jgi:hypothetical protein
MADEQIGKCLIQDAVESWFAAWRAETRCSCCGSPVEREKASKSASLCRGCRRAKSEIAKAKKDLESLSSSATGRKKRELEKGLTDRERVWGLRKFEGETLEMILAGHATLPHKLEEYFDEMGLCVGRKEALYGMMATRLGHWFSHSQIQLLCYLFWQAFHANSRNYGVKAARQDLLQRIKSATD